VSHFADAFGSRDRNCTAFGHGLRRSLRGALPLELARILERNPDNFLNNQLGDRHSWLEHKGIGPRLIISSVNVPVNPGWTVGAVK
jgi:hypothetical protein